MIDQENIYESDCEINQKRLWIAVGAGLQCVIINKSDDKKTIRSRVEDSAVDYWAVYVGGTKNNKHFYTMIKLMITHCNSDPF